MPVRLLLTGILAALTVAASAGAEPASPPARAAATTRPASTRPASTRPAKTADRLPGAIDPYRPGAERMRFFQAAGVDNELSDKEFRAAHGQDGSFVRAFERWEDLAVYDKNDNDTLDWFEVHAYRAELRKRVLKRFDADRDGQLTGRERDRANAALDAGHVRLANGAEPTTLPSRTKAARWLRQRALRQRRRLLAQYDRDADGRLDADERRAMLQAIRVEAETELAEMRRHQWDDDGDGVLSPDERARMEAELADRRQRAEAWRHDRELDRWDADGDGELDEAELAAMRADRAEQDRRGEETRRRWEMRLYDLDEDGRLDDEEQMLADAARTREEAYAEARGQRPSRRGRQAWRDVTRRWRLRHFDADGDGELAETEAEAARSFERDLRGIGQDLRRRSVDLDGDGEVTDDERAAAREEWRRAGWKVFARSYRYMDIDGDGQISPLERQEFGDRFREGMVRWIEDTSGRFDADRDGRLDRRERADLLAGVRRDFDDRMRDFDANRDGRLDPDETIDLLEDFVRRELGIQPNDADDRPLAD